MGNIVTGALVALAWIVAFGAFFAIAAALTSVPGGKWETRITMTFACLWIFGGGVAWFVHIAFGWLS